MSVLLHLYNVITWLLPTRAHRVRAWLLRQAGLQIATSAGLCRGVTFYGSSVRLGEEVWVSAQTTFSTIENVWISVGARCAIGPEVLFVTGGHEIGDHRQRAGVGVSQPITIGEGCWIGARAVILGGANVGDGCVVAAGAVVRPGAYPPDTLLAGVPAVAKKALVSGSGY